MKYKQIIRNFETIENTSEFYSISGSFSPASINTRQKTIFLKTYKLLEWGP